MKKLKNGCHFVNIDHIEKFQITDPPKFGSLIFQVLMDMEYYCQPLWKNWKMAAILLILIIWKNFKLLTPPKVWVSSFPSFDGNGISLLAIMEKLKNGFHFINIDHNGKISNYWPSPEFGSLVFQVLTKCNITVGHHETEYHCLWFSKPLWKNWKMAAISLILIIWKNCKLPTLPKFGSLVFRVSTEMEYHCRPLWKNWKMAAILLILIIWKNFKLPTPQSLGLWFTECCHGNGISLSAIMKKLKNGCHFVNIDHMEKFQITDPPKFGSLVFQVLPWNGISLSAIMDKIEKWLPFH